MWSSSPSQHPVLQFLLSLKTNIEHLINATEIVTIQTQPCILTYTKEKKQSCLIILRKITADSSETNPESNAKTQNGP